MFRGHAGMRIRWSACPLVGTVCRDQAWNPAFAPGTSEKAAGFGSLYLVENLPRLCMQLFLVPYSFFVSVAWEEVCPGANTSKGPRSQLVLEPEFTPWQVRCLYSCIET